jgi:hypothetical protein
MVRSVFQLEVTVEYDMSLCSSSWVAMVRSVLQCSTFPVQRYVYVAGMLTLPSCLLTVFPFRTVHSQWRCDVILLSRCTVYRHTEYIRKLELELEAVNFPSYNFERLHNHGKYHVLLFSLQFDLNVFLLSIRAAQNKRPVQWWCYVPTDADCGVHRIVTAFTYVVTWFISIQA